MRLRARIDAAGYGRAPIVRDLDLSVTNGEMVALLGPNGAGKTTTVRTVTGSLDHADVEVSLDGKPITGLRPRTTLDHGIAHVPEGRGIFATMSVEDNLLVCATGRPDERLRDSLLDRFPVLGERSRQKAGTLSGGEQQMLAIARALMTKPRFLLVDEPSQGLAPVIVESVMGLLREMCDQDGLGVLLAEQTQEVLEHSDTGYVLTNGALVTSAAAAELAKRDLFGLYTGDAGDVGADRNSDDRPDPEGAHE